MAGGNVSLFQVEVLDKDGATVTSGTTLTGTLKVPDAHFWWPHTMSDDYGYMYTLKVSGQSYLPPDVASSEYNM